MTTQRCPRKLPVFKETFHEHARTTLPHNQRILTSIMCRSHTMHDAQARGQNKPNTCDSRNIAEAHYTSLAVDDCASPHFSPLRFSASARADIGLRKWIAREPVVLWISVVVKKKKTTPLFFLLSRSNVPSCLLQILTFFRLMQLLALVVHGFQFRSLDTLEDGLTNGMPIFIHQHFSHLLSPTFAVLTKVHSTPSSTLHSISSSAPSRYTFQKVCRKFRFYQWS